MPLECIFFLFECIEMLCEVDRNLVILEYIYDLSFSIRISDHHIMILNSSGLAHVEFRILADALLQQFLPLGEIQIILGPFGHLRTQERLSKLHLVNLIFI
jgi:hypothetical protein